MAEKKRSNLGSRLTAMYGTGITYKELQSRYLGKPCRSIAPSPLDNSCSNLSVTNHLGQRCGRYKLPNQQSAANKSRNCCCMTLREALFGFGMAFRNLRQGKL